MKLVKKPLYFGVVLTRFFREARIHDSYRDTRFVNIVKRVWPQLSLNDQHLFWLHCFKKTFDSEPKVNWHIAVFN